MLGQAQKRAYFRNNNKLLGFNKENVKIHWFVVDNLISNNLCKIISENVNTLLPPGIISIQVGRNQIGKVKTDNLICSLKHESYEIHALIPNSVLIFSKIIPEVVWSSKTLKFKESTVWVDSF